MHIPYNHTLVQHNECFFFLSVEIRSVIPFHKVYHQHSYRNFQELQQYNFIMIIHVDQSAYSEADSDSITGVIFGAT